MPAILQLERIGKTYRGPDGPVQAVRDFTLSIQPKDFVAVRGVSGSGKTTILLIAGGLLRPDSGCVRFADIDPYAMSARSRAVLRARHVGFIFQEFYLVPYLSVLDNVLTPTLAQPMADAESRAADLLRQLGLAERRNHTTDALSTGERQRVALARALLPRPALLLADEPTGNLDRENSEIVVEALRAFAAGGGGVLMVTHNDSVAAGAHKTVKIQRPREAHGPPAVIVMGLNSVIEFNEQ